MLNMHASPKERYSSILSNSSIKLLSSSNNLDNDPNKKSAFASFSPSSPAPFSSLPSQRPSVIVSPPETSQNSPK